MSYEPFSSIISLIFNLVNKNGEGVMEMGRELEMGRESIFDKLNII